MKFKINLGVSNDRVEFLLILLEVEVLVQGEAVQLGEALPLVSQDLDLSLDHVELAGLDQDDVLARVAFAHDDSPQLHVSAVEQELDLD